MLFEWKIRISETENRCEESRMDSSPRFDGISKIYAIDFSCCMANEAKALSEIAEILGKAGEHLYWSVIYDRIKDAANRYLYDEDDGFYYDRCAATDKLIKVKTPASLLPLFAGFCDKKRADSIITKHLFNTDEFFTPFPVPSLAKNEEKFDGSIHRLHCLITATKKRRRRLWRTLCQTSRANTKTAVFCMNFTIRVLSFRRQK